MFWKTRRVFFFFCVARIDRTILYEPHKLYVFFSFYDLSFQKHLGPLAHASLVIIHTRASVINYMLSKV